MAYTKIHAIKATIDKAIEYICNPDKKPTNRSMFRLMRVRPKLRRSTLSIRLTIAGKTVPTKPIISYRLLLRARSVMRKRTALEKSLQTGF